MGQNLILDNGCVVVDKNFLDGHSRHLEERKMVFIEKAVALFKHVHFKLGLSRHYRIRHIERLAGLLVHQALTMLTALLPQQQQYPAVAAHLLQAVLLLSQQQEDLVDLPLGLFLQRVFLQLYKSMRVNFQGHPGSSSWGKPKVISLGHK